MYKDMAPEIEQVFLMSDLRYVFVRATRIGRWRPSATTCRAWCRRPAAAALAEIWPVKPWPPGRQQPVAVGHQLPHLVPADLVADDQLHGVGVPRRPELRRSAARRASRLGPVSWK